MDDGGGTRVRAGGLRRGVLRNYPPTKTERTTTLTPIGNTGYSLSKLEQLKYAPDADCQ